jgi:hypothetical protein
MFTNLLSIGQDIRFIGGGTGASGAPYAYDYASDTWLSASTSMADTDATGYAAGKFYIIDDQSGSTPCIVHKGNNGLDYALANSSVTGLLNPADTVNTSSSLIVLNADDTGYVTSDGVTFTAMPTIINPATHQVRSIVNDGTKLVAYGSNTSTTKLAVFTAPLSDLTGTGFNTSNLDVFGVAGSGANAIAATSGVIVVATQVSGASRIRRSTDHGVTFSSNITNPFTAGCISLAGTGSTFVGVGSNASGEAAISTDSGQSWSLVTVPSNNWNSVYTDGHIFMMIGNSKYSVSVDGTNWSAAKNLPASIPSLFPVGTFPF